MSNGYTSIGLMLKNSLIIMKRPNRAEVVKPDPVGFRLSCSGVISQQTLSGRVDLYTRFTHPDPETHNSYAVLDMPLSPLMSRGRNGINIWGFMYHNLNGSNSEQKVSIYRGHAHAGPVGKLVFFEKTRSDLVGLPNSFLPKEISFISKDDQYLSVTIRFIPRLFRYNVQIFYPALTGEYFIPLERAAEYVGLWEVDDTTRDINMETLLGVCLRQEYKEAVKNGLSHGQTRDLFEYAGIRG